MLSHSKVLGVRMSTYNWGRDTIQPIIPRKTQKPWEFWTRNCYCDFFLLPLAFQLKNNGTNILNRVAQSPPTNHNEIFSLTYLGVGPPVRNKILRFFEKDNPHYDNNTHISFIFFFCFCWVLFVCFEFAIFSFLLKLLFDRTISCIRFKREERADIFTFLWHLKFGFKIPRLVILFSLVFDFYLFADSETHYNCVEGVGKEHKEQGNTQGNMPLSSKWHTLYIWKIISPSGIFCRTRAISSFFL